jgi:organic radical activating enzyme
MSGLYGITEIFHSLQGEGHFVGYPMTFVRFAGCSVRECCIRQECDEAPFKSNYQLRAIDIVDACKGRSRTGIVCLTGGEPTDWDLLSVVVALRDSGFRVHLETSGVRAIDGIPFDWVTVSPKAAPLAVRQGHTLKVVVQPEWGLATQAWAHIAGMTDGTDFFHRYLQPLYDREGRPINLPQVVDMLIGDSTRNASARWALSVQAHKHWSVR